MNKKSIYFGTLVLAALALGSCASDDTATEKTAGKDTSKTGTVFSSETEPSTRTSATYTGNGLDFYWTANDKIWVKDDNGNYNQSADDDINTRIASVPGSTTTDKAKFWVNGTYSGGTYKVRYTGKNGVQDKVTIKASQTQNTPNDAAHIAEDGDFGVADATGSGAYNFTLNHKAAYVTFMPYNANGVISGAKIQKIRIYTNNTSDQLAGTFDLADNGTLSNGTTTSNSVELNVNDFTLPSAYSYTTNGATMVVNPGTYSNVTVEYTIRDAVTNVTGTVKKTYPSVTFDAGKNTPVRADLQIAVYPGNNYYMWDAKQNYWYQHEWNVSNQTDRWQPTIIGENNPNFPQNTDLERYHNGILSGSAGQRNDAQTLKFKNLPNANEIMWYHVYGTPHWDNDRVWGLMGHLYKGGMWIKKISKIASEQGITTANMKSVGPNGLDFRLNNSSFSSIVTPTPAVSTPPTASDINNYFFLPALGWYDSGVLKDVGSSGCGWYWASSAGGSSSASAWGLYFTSSGVWYNNSIPCNYGIYVMEF